MRERDTSTMSADGGWVRSLPSQATLLAALFLSGCDGDGSNDPDPASNEAPDQSGEVSAPNSGEVALDSVSQRCLLVSSDELLREDTFMDIASDYFYAMSEDCRTQRLMSTMTLDQMVNWFDYIYNYTSVLFGCGLQFAPLPGGAEAFGPGNVDAVGVVTTAFGVEDVAALIELYLGVCTTYVDIPSSELDAMRGELEAAAMPKIDATLGASLSECTVSAPAP